MSLLLMLGSSSPRVVVERRRAADRRAGQDRRQADHSPVAGQGDAVTRAGERRPTGTGLQYTGLEYTGLGLEYTGLEYTTAWQLPPGQSVG